MKKVITQIAAILFAAVSCLISCSKEIVDNKQQVVLPATETINIDTDHDIDYTGIAPASELRLSIVSESNWWLSISNTRAQTEWITTSATKGNAGTSTVTLNISENTSRDKRIAYIQLSNSSSSMTFTYIQQHYEPANLKLSTSKIEVSSEAVKETFTLESALDWTLSSSDESICTVSPIRGTAGTQTITVSITSNTSTEQERTATLTAQSGYETTCIKVIQERKKPELNIDRGIKTLDDLCRFRDAVNAGESLSEWKYNGEINLLADIDLSYIDEWQSIGTDKNPFRDTFNGNGFSVKNMKITTGDRNDGYDYGFFGTCTGGIIKNLVLKDAHSNSFGICGWLNPRQYPVKIINCTVSGYIEVAPFGFCSDPEDNSQHVHIIDCTNKAITHYPILDYGEVSEKTVVSSCANEGVYWAPQPYSHYDNLKFVDDGYKITEKLYNDFKQVGIMSMDAFIDYVCNSMKDLSIYMHGAYHTTINHIDQGREERVEYDEYWTVNENFIELAAQSKSLEELFVETYTTNDDGSPSKLIKKAGSIIDMFRDIKVLKCNMKFGHYHSDAYFSPLMQLYNVKPKLEKLILNLDPSVVRFYFDDSSSDEIFPILKRIECDGLELYNIPSSCKELVLSNPYDCNMSESYVSVDGQKLEYIEVSGHISELDVSETNLCNSTYKYPLKYLSTRSSPVLILKNGWEINGINKNVNYDYIRSDTVIQYVD